MDRDSIDEPDGRRGQELLPSRSPAKVSEQIRPAILSVLLLTVLGGVVFPLLLFAISRPLFPRQVRGSLIKRDGVVIGSELIGQEFTQSQYFQPRPSAAGSGYDGTASGGTNLSPNNPKLLNGSVDFAGVRQLAEAYRRCNGLASDAVIPIDAVTRSASGLDPHISLANALLQVSRLARARGMSEDTVRHLVMQHLEARQFGFLGEPRVSVLELNLALDQAGQPRTLPPAQVGDQRNSSAR